MNVCYVFQLDYPWDVRAEKILSSLAAHGFQAHVICRNREGRVRREVLQPGVDVHRLPAPRPAVLRNAINFPAFFSPVWLTSIRRVVRDVHASLIIVRDLPLAAAALAVGRMTGTPVMLDMAENYPAMIQDTWTYRGPGPADYLVRNPRMLKSLERRTVVRMDGVLVVSALSGERLQHLGVAADRITVVSNTPRIDREPPAAPAPAPAPTDRMLRLLYVGGLEESRGLDIVIRAVALLNGRPAVRFVIAGRGEGEAERTLQGLAASLGVSDRVQLTGWVSPADVPALIRGADICIVPHFVTEHTETTVPNKIFDYMWQERPVIASNATALRDIVESAGCGLVYEDTNPSALADVLRRLADPELRRGFGEAGRRAVVSRYNWSCDEERLIDAVRRAVRQGA